MSESNYEPGSMNVAEQNRTYHAVMAFAGRWGIPVSAALAVFFTGLLAGAGGLGAIVYGILTYVFARWVLMTFFAH